ncbi:hypothetical protein ACS0TY_026915 [Phlomoides rotata]
MDKGGKIHRKHPQNLFGRVTVAPHDYGLETRKKPMIRRRDTHQKRRTRHRPILLSHRRARKPLPEHVSVVRIDDTKLRPQLVQLRGTTKQPIFRCKFSQHRGKGTHCHPNGLSKNNPFTSPSICGS